VRVLLDTNVILDIALRRPHLFDGSKRALEKCEHEGHELSVSWHTLSNIFYILRRDRGGTKTAEFIRQLLTFSSVAPVNHESALRALDYQLNDFEDALQLTAAEGCGADLILTRNKADFGASPSVAVLTPEEFAERTG
jgi:predicted nucleic acid-binding protein